MRSVFAPAGLLVLSLVVTGCGTKSTGAGPDAGGQTTNACDITLTGAQTGAYKCGAQESPEDGPLFTYDAAKDQTNVTIAFNAPGDTPDFQGGLQFAGKPVVGTTYTLASTGADGSANVHHGDLLWTAASPTSTTPVAGSLTVTFTTLEGETAGPSSTTWSTVHGKIVATMPAAGGGATGTVTATATF